VWTLIEKKENVVKLTAESITRSLCCWYMDLKVIIAPAVFLLLQYQITVLSHFMQIYNM